jgi:hypothetical protein
MNLCVNTVFASVPIIHTYTETAEEITELGGKGGGGGNCCVNSFSEECEKAKCSISSMLF